ncbi:tudor domain-containing protein 15 isoform X2 [Pyxicephalus adspersus]|uniref:tudor domain-containing protein 15 isoform X2 n=1 Tax=Pyxicephalus adspersus TaxID=30357 RepID=UPI003B5BF56E
MLRKDRHKDILASLLVVNTLDKMDYMSLCQKPDLKMDLTILKVDCVPSEVLISFQGRYISTCEFDYHILQKEIQLVPKVNEDLNIGEFCLVQDKPLGLWHRGKILGKVKQRFEVVLIDQGDVVKVALEQIAAATGELFTLPPKIVNGMFSNVLPLDEKWSPRAINYFSSLVGDHLNGHVKTFLPHQVILLEVPKVINHAIELNVAKYMDSDTFCLLVELIHQLPANSHAKQMPDLLQQKKLTPYNSLSLSDNPPHFQNVLNHLMPVVSVETMEKIKISAAISPDNFYCHILLWEEELQKLKASMSSYYKSLKKDASSSFGNYGALCAAKRKDGQWYRGVIQTLLSGSDVKVWFIDIGSSEPIQSTDIHELKQEFLVLPMLAIPCALSSINDHGDNTKSMQLSLFREALVGHIVIAYIEQYNNEERVFNILLYDKEYELNSDCYLTNQKVPIFSSNTYTETVKSAFEKKSPVKALHEVSLLKPVDIEEIISSKSLQMEPDSVHVAYVEYVLNPSNFWIRTDECQNEFSAMMAEIAEIYNKCELMEMLVEDPQPGQLCCALYTKDGHYYRAAIAEVLNREICVYFIDFGNTETVPFYDVKILLPKFSSLPALAMSCTLAYAYPQEEVWVKSASDVFKEIVAGKALLCHVLAKHKFRHVVEMRLLESPERSDIVNLLVQAGCAEFWKVDLNPMSVVQTSPLPEKKTKYKGKNSNVRKCEATGDIKVSLSDWKMKPKTKNVSNCTASTNTTSNATAIYFRQYTFKPGTVTYVKCSHVESPGHFWCQLSCNLTVLEAFMDEIQTFYKSCNSRYQHGQMACIAKSSCTGKYYRASVVKHASRNEVDVIFVDYGMVERVLISELREIKSQFLKWEGQAFRCCLSMVLSFSAQHTWSANDCKDFKTFVDSASDIKSTIKAVFSYGSEELCNVVDLETPRWCSNHWLAKKGQPNPSKVLSIHLHTFCYSSFDLKVGSKELIYITYIYNTGKFYCQLAKNENIVNMLMRKVFELGKSKNPESGNKVQKLCIVKYDQDGNFYRVSACAIDEDHSLAFFVDFGDSLMIKKTELVPIPQEATDVLFEPMQAIPCYLSGLEEATFTTEAKVWMEEQCVGKCLSATVVSIDNKGHLEVDLCWDNISVNGKIKAILGVDSQPKVSKNAGKAESRTASLPVCAEKHTLQSLNKKSGSNGEDKHTPIFDLNANAIPCVNVSSGLDSSQNSTCKELEKVKFYDDVEASKSSSHSLVENFSYPPAPKKPFRSTDLPEMILQTGSTHLAYASHICSPSEFYIQLSENEKQVLQLEEELNNMSFQPINVNHLEKDTLVVAQYPDDKAFYRADIKEILKGNSFEVEFIDYGNTAKVCFSSIFKLPERFFNVPRLSISVFLTGFQKSQNVEWSKNAVDKFSEKVTNTLFSCMFLCRHDNEWEVSITLKGRSLTEFLQSFAAAPELSALDLKDTLPGLDIVLKPSKMEKVKTVYLSKRGILFVTLARFAEACQISEQISAVVRQADNRLIAKDISEGMVCLAKSEKMQTWFRATVEKIFPKTKEMSVFFVDHGAREVISMHNAKSLPTSALSLPHQAIACKWVWTEKVGLDFFQLQMQSILQNELQILFLKFLETESCWKIDILVDDVLLMEHFNTMSQQNTKMKDSVVSCFHYETENLQPSISQVSLKSLEVHAGFVTAFLNPFSFSVQLENSVVSMNKLSELIEKLTDDLLPVTLDLVKLGSACLVKCFETDEWCRAEIASINMTSILLNLVDYGVYKPIPYSEYRKLKMISKEIASLPALTYRCRLHGVLPKNVKDWSAGAIKYCMDFIQDRDLIVLPVKIMDNNVTEVSIYGEGNLAEKLIAKGFAIEANSRCLAEVVPEPGTSPLPETKYNLQGLAYEH